jgi:hypothetical protein
VFLWSAVGVATPLGNSTGQNEPAVPAVSSQQSGEKPAVVPGGDQGQQQEEQGQQVEGRKRVGLFLAYLRWKKGEALTIRDLVKAKVMTGAAKRLVQFMKLTMEETGMDAEELAKRLQVRVEEFRADSVEEQAEQQKDTSIIEKLKAVIADRVGEEECIQGILDWSQGVLDRIDSLREKIEGTEATPLLDKFQSRIESLNLRASDALAD